MVDMIGDHEQLVLAREEIRAKQRDIDRLVSWLKYIEGNFGYGPESAAKALAGDPIPKDFTP